MHADTRTVTCPVFGRHDLRRHQVIVPRTTWLLPLGPLAVFHVVVLNPNEPHLYHQPNLPTDGRLCVGPFTTVLVREETHQAGRFIFLFPEI